MNELSKNEIVELRQLGTQKDECNDDNALVISPDDMQRLSAEVVRCAFIWSRLNHSISRLEQRMGAEMPAVEEAPAEEVPVAPLPHFGLDDRCEGHWADVYHRLCAMGCFDSREVTVGDFRYVCCGKGTAPTAPLVWHGRVNALAYIVRRHMGHRWATARACFRLADRPLPASFESTQPPRSPKVCEKLDAVFGNVNYRK